MKVPNTLLAPLTGSLSARLLVFTIFFVMLSEVLIYVPSIARYRLVYLQQHLASAQIASLVLEMAPRDGIAEDLRRQLLDSAGARVVVLKRKDSRHLILSENMPVAIDAVYDIRTSAPWWDQIADSFVALWPAHDGSASGGGRIIRLIGNSEAIPGATLEVILDEAPMQAAMYDYSIRIFRVSIIISVLTASLVYLTLQWLMVRPMKRITHSMVAFRENPEDLSRIIEHTSRSDEIGTAQRALAEMQSDLRAALSQKARLAALGEAVSKINHDLRNLLASAQLVSDRLASSKDPTVKEITPVLVANIDRAITLCTQTLEFGKPDDRKPRRLRFQLETLMQDLHNTTAFPANGRVVWRTDIDPNFEVDGDPEFVFRILLNLTRNAVQAIESMAAGEQTGEVCVSASRHHGVAEIEVADTGPGVDEKVRAQLFQPFAGSARKGGTGLGMSIARDLARAHGGDIKLVRTGSDGTVFRLTIPDA